MQKKELKKKQYRTGSKKRFYGEHFIGIFQHAELAYYVSYFRYSYVTNIYNMLRFKRILGGDWISQVIMNFIFRGLHQHHDIEQHRSK